MTIRKLYIGSVGPFIYDDTDLVNDYDGDFSGEYRQGFLTDGYVKTTATPNSTGEVLRFDEIGTLVVGTERVVESFTATGTIDEDTNIVLADGTFILFLPTLADGEDRVYDVKNVGTGIITLKPNSAEATVEIEGELSQPMYPGDCFTVTSDGTDWWVI